jgi:DNA polymerase III epsilon subunit-like protein
MSDDFVAIDVETANADAASICQVGIVVFAGGHEAATCEFSEFCPLVSLNSVPSAGG